MMGVIDSFVFAHNHPRRNMDPMFVPQYAKEAMIFQGWAICTDLGTRLADGEHDLSIEG